MQTRAPVRRHVRLPANWARGYGEELAREVSAAAPACTAEYDPRRHAVWLEYDRVRCGLAEIEPVLERYHFWPPRSWWQRLRRAWALFTEANLRENLHAAPSSCCNRPPRRPARTP